MAYGTGGVFKRRDTFWVHYSIHGRVIRESAKTTSRDKALAFLAQRRFEMGVTAPAPREGQQTVAMLCARVIVRYTKRKQASLSTARGHEAAWLAALGGDTLLDALSVETLTPTLEGWEGDEYSAATINRRLSFLRVGLRLLGRRSQIDFAELRKPEENTRDGYLSRVDFDKLYAAALAFDPDLAEFFAWLYVTGMRKGEARKLTIAMVDRRTWTLRIPGRIQKNRKDRGLQLSGIMRTLVAARLAKQTRGCEFLFHRAGEPIREFKHAWKTLVAKAGLEDVRPHDLRRSAVTNMLESNPPFTVAQIMAITGHRTPAMVLRYAQVVDAHLDEKMAALSMPSCLTGTAA